VTRVAIVGIGRWGKNLLREFNKLCDVPVCCSKGNKQNLEWLKKNYPSINAFHYDDVLMDKTIDAVVIATPIDSHFELAYKALSAGKHVFVEKPMAKNIDDAKKLIRAAKKQNLILFVGHVFLYHPVFKKIKEITRKEPVKYARFVWNKFGTFDEDIIWNIISHEVSIAIKLFGIPKNISILDEKGFFTKRDIVSVSLGFKANRCLINVNRVSNSKNKSITFVTRNNLFLWENDALYRLDKRMNSFSLIYQSNAQPLAVECREFIENIRKRKRPYTDGNFGLDVVKVLARLK